MDPIDVLDLCRKAAHDEVGMPVGAHIPHVFSVGDYQRLWLDEPKKVRVILDDLLCAPRVGDGLEMLLQFNVIYALFPELAAMKDLGDANGLHKDVWEHTKIVVAGVPGEVDMRWGALMHDIGKARTRRILQGKVTFHAHDIVGARMVNDLNGRTNLFLGDVALLRTVRKLVEFHLRPASYKSSWSDNGVRRLITECGDTKFIDKLMTLSRADLTTKVPAKRDRAKKNADALMVRIEVELKKAQAPKLPKLVMGIILEIDGKKPGKWLNELRDELQAKMLSGELDGGRDIDYYVSAGLEIRNK